jgi:hypothetical protein
MSGSLPTRLAADLDGIDAAGSGNGSAQMRRGADEWSWRLSVCGDRRYRFFVACRGDQPLGYIVVRRLTPGSSRLLGSIPAAVVTDLVTVNDDSRLVRALAARAVACGSELGAAVVLATTTNQGHQRAFTGMGFLSPRFPLLGRFLGKRAPQYMWRPKGPGAELAVDGVSLTFADSDVDLNL